LARLDQMVLKPVDGSGGYGLVIGPQASDEDLARLRTAVIAEPRQWIAQGIVQLSTSPTHTGDGFGPRHVDLRPFAVNEGGRIWVAPGGLTRVALPAGSLVVNSSQGGGSKDTWVLTPAGEALERLVASGARQPGAVWKRPESGPSLQQSAQQGQQQQARTRC
jgi:uncharacterized circularly permuted ATP-grasp superfamily protein